MRVCGVVVGGVGGGVGGVAEWDVCGVAVCGRCLCVCVLGEALCGLHG